MADGIKTVRELVKEQFKVEMQKYQANGPGGGAIASSSKVHTPPAKEDVHEHHPFECSSTKPQTGWWRKRKRKPRDESGEPGSGPVMKIRRLNPVSLPGENSNAVLTWNYKPI
ncbi:hypothetical protein B0H13DRAFT_1853381 [Mycena leptocephala]|nr:hypothetical protein B0H13DRAFT_1853381 [Mycena leptocephala]